MDSGDLKTISELEKKVKKYEAKMRDLIEAYKCLNKEKETLEKTVESFTRQRKINNNNEGSSEVERLKNELATLSTSIASLTEERRRMERSYLEDKRVMRAEYESNIKAVRSELEAQSVITETLRSKLKTKTINMERVDENLIERDYQLTVLNDECSRLRLELSTFQRDRMAEKNGYEIRVAQLEETIADISRNIGLMEKQHLTDSDTISKLTDRVQILVSESRSGCKSRESQSDTPDILQFQELDKVAATKAMIEKMCRLRGQLHAIDPSLDLGAMMGGAEDGSGSCCGCSTKIRQLTEDLECAQLKLESVLRVQSSTTYSSHQQQELDRVTEDLLRTRARVAELQDDLSSLDAQASHKDRALRDTIAKNERSHKQEMAKLRQDHNQTVTELQSELTKHRNRTINLLAEKDTEIQSLQRIVQARATGRAMIGDDHSLHGGTTAVPEEDDDARRDLSSAVSKYDSSCPLYQCCETKARMEQELRRVRHDRRQLEMSVHRMEAEHEYSRTDWHSEMCALRDRVTAAETLGRLGSIVNVEYLRNVFLRYLTTTDESCKALMSRAMGQVLQISAKDLQAAATNTARDRRT